MCILYIYIYRESVSVKAMGHLAHLQMTCVSMPRVPLVRYVAPISSSSSSRKVDVVWVFSFARVRNQSEVARH